MKPSFINIKEYDYPLPEDCIAKFPLENRTDSKLLMYKEGLITHHSFSYIPNLIPPNSLLLFNNTCVIEARIKFKKDSGAEIEVFLLHPHLLENATSVLKSTGNVSWKCMVGNKKRWKEEDILSKTQGNLFLKAKWLDRDQDTVSFEFNTDLAFEEIIREFGSIPIPPYLNRETTNEDLVRYQTVFAKNKGSVAAPTAALHFDEIIYGELDKRDIQYDYLTLHVGAGTFKPVSTENAIDHEMHQEYILFTKDCILHLLRHQQNIIAVGTTSLRSLESLYWFGVGLKLGELTQFHISQYFPYQIKDEISVEESMHHVLQWMEMNHLDVLEGTSSIFIVPGYKVKMAKAIITNFHQPQSTLLLLIASLIGNDWKKVYSEALKHEYRFLSYGDSSILFF